MNEPMVLKQVPKLKYLFIFLSNPDIAYEMDCSVTAFTHNYPQKHNSTKVIRFDEIP